jgi:hypothetical protein
MSASPRRSSAPRRAALALALAACAAAALTPASVAVGPREATVAATPRSVHVTGEFIPIDNVGTYRITGDLMGTWYTLTADTYYQSKAMIIQKGLERFEGCFDLNNNRRCDKGRKGQFAMDYMYWATFNPQTERLIKGECIHPITAGKGVFSKMRGFINVQDKPVGKNGVVSTYQGELVLNAVSKEKDSVSDAPAALSAKPSAGC